MELWDLYDENRHPLGRTHVRGDKIPDGCYHITVDVWIRNSRREYLISQRAANRPTFPLKWECVGGSVLAGETSFQGMLRETKEEVGISLDIAHMEPVLSVTGRVIDGFHFSDIKDVYLVEYSGDVSLKNATTDEVAQVKWMTVPQIRALWDSGEMVHTLGYFFDEIEKGKTENVSQSGISHSGIR